MESNDVSSQRGLLEGATDDALKPLPVRRSVRHTNEETFEVVVEHITLVCVRRDYYQGHAALDKQTCQEVGLRTTGDPTHRGPRPGHSSRPRLEGGPELYAR